MNAIIQNIQKHSLFGKKLNHNQKIFFFTNEQTEMLKIIKQELEKHSKNANATDSKKINVLIKLINDFDPSIVEQLKSIPMGNFDGDTKNLIEKFLNSVWFYIVSQQTVKKSEFCFIVKQ